MDVGAEMDVGTDCAKAATGKSSRAKVRRIWFGAEYFRFKCFGTGCFKVFSVMERMFCRKQASEVTTPLVGVASQFNARLY